MLGILICHRKEDAASAIRLSAAIGDLGLVHRRDDTASNPVTAEDDIRNCNVFVLIIGPTWLTTINEHGMRRIDDPDDPVRRRLGLVGLYNSPLIVVLTDNARFPTGEDLPADLWYLTTSGIHVHAMDMSFEHDYDELIAWLREITAGEEWKFRPIGSTATMTGSSGSPPRTPKPPAPLRSSGLGSVIGSISAAIGNAAHNVLDKFRHKSEPHGMPAPQPAPPSTIAPTPPSPPSLAEPETPLEMFPATAAPESPQETPMPSVAAAPESPEETPAPSVAATPEPQSMEVEEPRASHVDEAPSIPTIDPVLLGVSAPQQIRAGDEFTARFAAYLEGHANAVEKELGNLSARSTSHMGLKTCQWQRGTKVTVSLAAHDLVVGPPSQEFIWNGERVILDFDVVVPASLPDSTIVLKFDVSIDDIIVARLRLDLQIVARDSPVQPSTTPAAATTMAAKTAFASYASKDRQRVLDRVAAVRISAGLEIFLDCVSLRPGDGWKLKLADEIKARDLFLLFWSDEAARSTWVEWEWQAALREKGKSAMQIHPLQHGIRPPEPLKDLHFGDTYMLVREGDRAREISAS